MASLSPEGPVYQAGTLSGNPLAMAAGIATLRVLRDWAVYEQLDRLSGRFTEGLASILSLHGVRHSVARAGSLVGFFLTEGPIRDLPSAKRSDTALYARFFHAMLDRGIYLAPSQFESGFLSTAHTDADVDRTLAAADEALGELLVGMPS